MSTSILRAIFSFRTGSTTAVASLFYLAIFTSLYVTQYGPSVPSLQRQHALGLSVEHAYRDLHLIAERPHPYNSRQNDVVRNFLLRRLQEIGRGHDFIHVEDDVKTNAAFLDGPRAVYFQGTNILVKIDGTDNTTKDDWVLFSAHFDSASTAPGATDDGMSVAALIQMISFLSENRPRRTAVFNINNGEEDGLHGAHAFLRHPWSNLTSIFLNFEGAGSGGRPFLFRSTSYDVLKDFRSAPHIHADALSQDAWDRGVIRSDTDYSVYSAPRIWDASSLAEKKMPPNATGHGYQGSGGGMQGADVAFYTTRSRYHTMDDSIRGMGDGGAEKSLWALMELVRTVGNRILNTRSKNGPSDENERGVYFELFGVYLVAFRFRVLVVAEMVLIAMGPILFTCLGLLALTQQSVEFISRLSLSSLIPSRTTANYPVTWATFTNLMAHLCFRGYGRFWLALTLGTGAQVGLMVGFLRLNRNTAHAHTVATSLSALALAYLSLAIPLQRAQRLRPIPASKQRSVILIELYALTWVFLVGATILTRRVGVAGLSWIPLWNASLLVAVVLSMFESLTDTCQVDTVDPREEGIEASETTPLLQQPARPTNSLVLDDRTNDSAPFWWIFQFLCSAAAPVVNLATIFSIWVSALPQTIPDGGSVATVYVPISLLSFLIVLPLAPFVHKVHRVLTILMLIVFITSTAYAWLAPPFNTGARLKVFFAHGVELTNMTKATPRPQLMRAVTQLHVIEGYGPRLVAALPSSWGGADNGDVQCEAGKLRPGITTCAWAVPPALYPSTRGARGDKGAWLVANATRLGPTSLRVEIEGFETRSCRIYVDSHGIRRYRARTRQEGSRRESSESSAQVAWSAFKVPAGEEVHLLALWARGWGSRFEVELDVDVDADAEAITGRVSCLWNDGPGGARIPALEEARSFLPEWVAISTAASGLVEAVSGFVL